MALDENALVTWGKTKSLLGLDDSDQVRYEELINAASAVANKYTGRRLKARDYTITLDGHGRDELILPEYPVNSVTTLYIDTERNFGSETGVTDYLLYEEEGLLYYESGFPNVRKSVRVEYNAGFAAEAVPEDIQIAVVEIVAWMGARYSASGEGIGIRQITTPGGGATEYEMTIPLAAQRKLDPYVRREYGI